jgi:two-component system, OmpR family, phosphate regulon response regulator PhoB
MGCYILIVENEPDIADVVRRYLEFERFTTVCVTSCEDARDSLAARLPDLIVLDWKLPDVNGDAWIAELRASDITAGIPIVMVTGGYPTQALLAQMEAAKIPILIKPFPLDNLIDHIARMLRCQAIGAQ